MYYALCQESLFFVLHPPSQEDGSWDVNGQLPTIFSLSADLFCKVQTVGGGQTKLRRPWT